ncbi:hypothetical protein BHE74_00005748 [Ensete ventricosum]|nr:hypothetical protein BHE74_00005748 [Ensete ventricosum]RZR82375.1 hypothetical protein BHM03_00008766 [Ensete ventricosum]
MSTIANRFRVVSVEGGRKKKREKNTWSPLHPIDLSPTGDFFADERFLLPARGEEKSPCVGRRNKAA